MSKPPPPKPTSLFTTLQKYTGFTSPLSLKLFLLTALAFSLFSALQTTSLPPGHSLKPDPPGEHFWFGRERWPRVWMNVHLGCVIPAGILLPVQFLPVMRRRGLVGMHRWLGKVLFGLLGVGNLSAIMMAPYSYGGTITNQIWVFAVAFLSTFSIYKAWSSIRRLRINEHRAWVLRTWSYACTILTLRFLMGIISISAKILSPGRYKTVVSCKEIVYMYEQLYLANLSTSKGLQYIYERYPACKITDGEYGEVDVVVTASLAHWDVKPEERWAMMKLVFGVAGWVALVGHVLLVEVYLSATKGEGERLRRVSDGRRGALGLDGEEGERLRKLSVIRRAMGLEGDGKEE